MAPALEWKVNGIAADLDDPVKTVWIEALGCVDEAFVGAKGIPVKRAVELLKDPRPSPRAKSRAHLTKILQRDLF